MAFSASKPALVKQLRELLQEQQEPFVLDVYLSERWYRKKNFGSEGRNGCYAINSAKNLKRSCSYDLNKKRSGIPYASRILRSVLNVLVSGKDSRNLSNCNSRAHREHVSDTMGKTEEIAEANVLSSASSLTLSMSSSEKQNPVGVEELLEIIGSGSSQYLKTKRVLQQTKQLLFDCVKEAKEIHGKKGKIWKYTQEFLGPVELGKIIAEHICSWGKQSGDATNITQLIHSDFSSTIEEWSNFQPLTREIGIKIGNAIMDEIVMEIIDLFLQ